MWPRSWECVGGLGLEQGGVRLWLELPSAGGSTAVWWAFLQQWVLPAATEPSDLMGSQHSSVATGVWQLAFQTEKQSHTACPPLSLPELASFCPWGGAVEHIICKLRNWH